MAHSVKRFDPNAFLRRVGDGKTIAEINPGEIVCKQGTPADRVYYLQAGRAKETVISEGGKDALVGILEPGLFFGTSTLDGDHMHPSTVAAITACTVTAITREAMRRALDEPSFSQMFVAYLLDHSSKMEAEKLDFLFHSSEQRLAQKLVDLAQANSGRPTLTIGPEITQEMLAEMIGTTRPRVNYFLNRWRKLGFIKYNGGIVVLPALLAAMKEWKTGRP